MVTTSVHTHEITEHAAHSDDLDQDFRFRGTRSERSRWLAIMRQVEENPRRFARFAECGTSAWVQYSRSRGSRRIVANCCKQRQCPACRKWWSRRTRNALAYAMAGSPPHAWKLLTLTLKHDSAPLTEQLEFLLASFRRLRNRAAWKARTPYGYAVIEITHNAKTDRWHPHLHVLIRCPYFPHKELSELWRSCTHGSFIVDIRQVKDARDAAQYVAKYLAKPVEDSVLGSLDLAREWLAAVRAHRSLIAFGKDRPYIPPEDSDGFPDDWTYEQPLKPLLERWHAGDPDAAIVLATVNAEPPYDPFDLNPPESKPPPD